MPHLKLDTNHLLQMQNASFIIGSDPTCDLPLTGQNILPRHLILQSRGDRWQAATLALNAPVLINGRPMDSMVLLNDNDHIHIGDVVFIWKEQSAPEANASPWRGLLIIFLVVMTLLSSILAWFRLSSGYQMSLSVLPTPRPAIIITTPGAQSESELMLPPHGYTEEGHPVYRIELP
jgi:hypothetical protein